MKWRWIKEKKWYHKLADLLKVKLKKFKYWVDTEDFTFDLKSTHELKPKEADNLFQLSLQHHKAKLKLTNCPKCKTLITAHKGKAECCYKFKPKVIKKVEYIYKAKDQNWSVNTIIK